MKNNNFKNHYLFNKQVENEYGSYYACDGFYTAHLRDVIKSVVGTAALLYSTDGGGIGYLKCGKVAEVYATVDFGTGEPQFIALILFCR